MDVVAALREYVTQHGWRQLYLRIHELLTPRDSRFEFDDPLIAMYVERSKNKNLAIYSGNYNVSNSPNQEQETFAFDTEHPMEEGWLELESEAKEKNIEKGNLSHRSPFTFLQRTVAYGTTVRPLNKQVQKSIQEVVTEVPHPIDGVHQVTFTAFKSYNFLLFSVLPKRKLISDAQQLPEPTGTWERYHHNFPVPVLLGVSEKGLFILEKVYVRTQEPRYFYQMPIIIFIDAYGIYLNSGEKFVQRVKGKPDVKHA